MQLGKAHCRGTFPPEFPKDLHGLDGIGGPCKKIFRADQGHRKRGEGFQKRGKKREDQPQHQQSPQKDGPARGEPLPDGLAPEQPVGIADGHGKGLFREGEEEKALLHAGPGFRHRGRRHQLRRYRRSEGEEPGSAQGDEDLSLLRQEKGPLLVAEQIAAAEEMEGGKSPDKPLPDAGRLGKNDEGTAVGR